jgi:hypothetical protein
MLDTERVARVTAMRASERAWIAVATARFPRQKPQ